jgi:hypothetical protein
MSGNEAATKILRFVAQIRSLDDSRPSNIIEFINSTDLDEIDDNLAESFS